MKKMFFYIVVAIFALMLIIFALGIILPKQRTFEKVHIFQAPIERVFQVVTDLEEQVAWRSDVKEIQVKSAEYGKEIWVEIPKSQPPIYFHSTMKIQNERYEMDIEGQGFKGHWIGIFEKINGSTTRVTFLETATVENPFFRVFAYLFVDLHKVINLYISDLSKKLDQ